MKRLIRSMTLLTVLLLCLAPAASASNYDPIVLTEEEAAAVNLFLSNFTEVGMKSCENSWDDMNLVDFAHDHMWFNSHDSYEFGEYFSGNNCRVSDDRIQEIIDKYFYDPYEVDLSQTRFDYADGYYYHCETGGWTDCGFAHAVSVCPIGEDKYFVSFLIFGGGYDWDNSVMDDSLEEIEAAFGHPSGYGSALIYAPDLSDRSTHRMISFARV